MAISQQLPTSHSDRLCLAVIPLVREKHLSIFSKEASYKNGKREKEKASTNKQKHICLLSRKRSQEKWTRTDKTQDVYYPASSFFSPWEWAEHWHQMGILELLNVCKGKNVLKSDALPSYKETGTPVSRIRGFDFIGYCFMVISRMFFSMLETISKVCCSSFPGQKRRCQKQSICGRTAETWAPQKSSALAMCWQPFWVQLQRCDPIGPLCGSHFDIP